MRIPSYRLHKPSRQAIVTVRGRTHYLGRHNSPESRAAYQRIITEYIANGSVTPPAGSQHSTTVAELADAFLTWARLNVLPRRSGRSSFSRVERAMRAVLACYPAIPAAQFGAPELFTVRSWMIQQRWCRVEINQVVGVVRRCWKWGVLHRRTTGESLSQLQAVAPIRGRTPGVKDSPPKYQPPLRDIVATCRHVPPDVRAFALALYWCGARPSELIRATAADIVSVADDVRAITHSEHKTDHHGHGDRTILIGPRARAVLDPLIRQRPTGPLFRRRDKDRRGRWIGNTAKILRAACDVAGVKRWTLYSLRRAAATRWVRLLGDSQARRLLGHVAGGALAAYDQAGPDIAAIRRAG